MDLFEKIVLGTMGTISAIAILTGMFQEAQKRNRTLTPFTHEGVSYNFRVSSQGYTVGLGQSPAQGAYILDSDRDGSPDKVVIKSPSKFGMLVREVAPTQRVKDIFDKGYSAFSSR